MSKRHSTQPAAKSSPFKITAYTGLSIVVANMIGTGAFTSLGFQLEGLTHTGALLTLWLLGGVMALCGALSYAEVGTIIKVSGGEYAFLSRLYHPFVGYLSGWVSLTVGFAAPIALSVIAFTQYLPVTLAYPRLIGVLLVVGITLVHSFHLKSAALFQDVSTLLKLLLVLSIVCVGLLFPASTDNALYFESSYFNEVSSVFFAVSLVYVSYSYSGWNAAAYITEEFKNPRKALPIALIGGTLVVTILYTLLQFVFMKHASMEALSGKLNVGAIAVQQMLGVEAANLFSVAICLLLISGISAMVWVGPRVTASIAEEHVGWSFFRSVPGEIPKKALWLQCAISAILLLTGTFEQIIIYCGFLLNLSTLLVVFGVFIIRKKRMNQSVESFRSPLFPLPQLLFIVVSLWMLLFVLYNNPYESLLGLSNLLLGAITYLLTHRKHPPKNEGAVSATSRA